MQPQYFAEDDKKKTVEFLNYVAKFAKFEMNTEQLIQYFKLLSHMQGSILPKIEANILEVRAVVEAPKEQVPQSKKGK